MIVILIFIFFNEVQETLIVRVDKRRYQFTEDENM